uniref:Uncharacterized protein n=1 Tax=Aegilops tauschii subsp. strangulata TaxID=200361 RepID=A0A453FC83_AEGTS
MVIKYLQLWCFDDSSNSYFCLHQVDDVLETKLDRKFKVITDKGTLDAIGLHPDGRAKRYKNYNSVILWLATPLKFPFRLLSTSVITHSCGIKYC